jgi:hypothetical protein
LPDRAPLSKALRGRPKRALIETQQIVSRSAVWPGFKILDAIPRSDDYGNVISPDLHVKGPLAAFDPSNCGFSGYVEVPSLGIPPANVSDMLQRAMGMWLCDTGYLVSHFRSRVYLQEPVLTAANNPTTIELLCKACPFCVRDYPSVKSCRRTSPLPTK